MHARTLARTGTIAIVFAVATSQAAATPVVPRQGDAPRPTRSAAAESLLVSDLLAVRSASVSDLSSDGRWLAVTITERRDGLGADFYRDGDPTYVRGTPGELLVIDTRTMAQRPVFRSKTAVRGVSWSPDDSKLAMLVIDSGAIRVQVWDRGTGRFVSPRLPAGQYIAENSELEWTRDGSALVFSVRPEVWRARARQRFEALTRGPVTVLDASDPFLEWDEMRRMSAERSIVAWNLTSGALSTLHTGGLLGNWTLADDGSAITVQEDVTKKTDYDVIFGREFRLVTQSASGGEPRVLAATLRGTQLLWAPDGKRYLMSREGRVLLGSINDTTRRQLLGPAQGSRSATPNAEADTSAAARAARAKERFSAVRWSPQGDAIVASNSEGLWLVNLDGGREMIAAVPDSTSLAPRPQLTTWSDDGRYLYFAENARDTWDRAITRYDRETKEKRELVRGARFFTGLRLSKDGSTAVLSVAEGNRPADLYVADAALGNMRRAVESNPQLAEKPLSRTELLSYLDADGDTRYGVLHYPTNYVQGQRYPTVFIIYESFFDNTFDAVANLLAANGYAVVKPSVGFDIGYPGEAWLKGVTAAANAVIQMGVADSARLGVHGTSYGGYAVNLLITQTDRFKAAINISGKVDIISFYTDSPRLGVRNIHAAEKSQDRIGATLWQQPHKYVEHSAVMFADRIKTPLLLLTGGQDHNVPAINTREMYYALRRLGKPVVWVNYVNGGHGVPTTNEREFTDFHQRMLDWYDRYLKGKKTTNVTEAGQP